ncbi:MAG: hypothetical protein RIC35_21190 [Marinoscillum sp.]
MEEYSAKSALNVLRIIHFALMAGLIIFGTVVTYLILSGSTSADQGMDIIKYLPGLMFLTVVPFSSFMFRKNLDPIKKPVSSLKDKLAAYQTAHIVRMASFEAVGLFAVVTCFVTSTLLNLGVLAIVLAFFIIKTPSVSQLENNPGLTQEEKNQLE